MHLLAYKFIPNVLLRILSIINIFFALKVLYFIFFMKCIHLSVCIIKVITTEYIACFWQFSPDEGGLVYNSIKKGKLEGYMCTGDRMPHPKIYCMWKIERGTPGTLKAVVRPEKLVEEFTKSNYFIVIFKNVDSIHHKQVKRSFLLHPVAVYHWRCCCDLLGST